MPVVKITSFSNPHIKHVVKLRENKARQETGLTIVEGAREIKAAQESGVVFKEIYICDDFKEVVPLNEFVNIFTKKQILILETSKEIFAKISYGDRMEGILAVCEIPQHDWMSLKLTQKPLYVIVENVEKPGNLGAMMRTCDAAGVDGLIVCDPKTDIYNPNVIRASLGTVFSIPIFVSTNSAVWEFLSNQKINICASSPEAKIIYTQVNLNIPLAIVVGSEDKGLSDFWLKKAKLQVKIPMKGRANSLNVSATAATLIYEVVRQRGLKG